MRFHAAGPNISDELSSSQSGRYRRTRTLEGCINCPRAGFLPPRARRFIGRGRDKSPSAVLFGCGGRHEEGTARGMKSSNRRDPFDSREVLHKSVEKELLPSLPPSSKLKRRVARGPGR